MAANRRCDRLIQATLTMAVVVSVAGCSLNETTQKDTASGTSPPATSVPRSSELANPRASTYTAPPPLPVASAGTPAGTALPNQNKVDRQDPSATSLAAVTMMWTVDTTIDLGEHEATLRAAPYFSPDYLDQVGEAVPITAPGATWETWRQHRAYTVVTAESADEIGKPPDTDVEAFRSWEVTSEPVGRDGWKGEKEVVLVYISLVRSTAQGPWQVSGVHVR